MCGDFKINLGFSSKLRTVNKRSFYILQMSGAEPVERGFTMEECVTIAKSSLHNSFGVPPAKTILHCSPSSSVGFTYLIGEGQRQ